MRPATLAEAYDRMIGGDPRDMALAEFLDTFYLATIEQRVGSLQTEPRLTGDARLDALAGAVAEYLSRQYRLNQVPCWAFGATRYLDRPWHTTSFESDAMREYLTASSPAEFASRNIFTEERPLRRARSHLRQL